MVSTTRSLGDVVGDYVALTKPRLSGLVLFTAAGGMWLSDKSLDWKTWLFAMLGTAGTVGSANTINCVIERDSDRFMARTAKRPLPGQRMESKHALVFAVVLGLISLPMLALGVNVLTGVLGLLALASYAFVYTPMKSRTRFAMQVGAFPGALPPLMGWTAATGRIELPGLVLFAILFVWQLPHFIAIALFRKSEYRAAGLTSLPLEKGDDTARLHAVGYVAVLLPISVAPYFVGVAGWLYLVVAGVLGAVFLTVAIRGWLGKRGDVWARQLFMTSLLYLTGLFAALGLGS
ncbi:MAG: heme o synthase [Archangium sp.]|nr:heme o synthase [Archangium sp.]MDP3157052.1 heme o synthase [Archangium sp.]MDP3575769.1 heme o synthase [Archangium sp.]